MSRTSSNHRSSGELKTLILFSIILLFVLAFAMVYSYISLMVIMMSIAGAVSYISWNRVSNSDSHSPDYIQSGEAGAASLLLLLLLIYIPSWPVAAAVITTFLLFILEYIIFIPATSNRRTRFLPGIIIMSVLAVFIYYIAREGVYPGMILLWSPFLGFSDLSLSFNTIIGFTVISLLLYVFILVVNPGFKLHAYGKRYIQLTGIHPSLANIILSTVRSLLVVLLIVTMGWMGALLKYLPVLYRSPTPAGEITTITIILVYMLGIYIILVYLPAGIVLALMLLLSYILTCAKIYLLPRWKVYR
ncbi:MAG: hypothetical protein ACOCX9_02650 [Spirochaetota bacterium]